MISPVDKLALEIDEAAETGNTDKLMVLLVQCQQDSDRAIEAERPVYHFYEANCHSALAHLKSHDPGYIWSWHQDERISEILALRKALSDAGFSDLEPIIKAKIFTNLGNSLNQLGRFCEAIEYWDSALSLFPNFAMALGNKAQGLMYYGRTLYDEGHKAVLVASAADIFDQLLSGNALWDSGIHAEAKRSFEEYWNQAKLYLEHIQYDYDRDLDQWLLGENEKDINYRGWCLHHKLFLSPLNDACKLSVAAQDVLHLPSHVYNIKEKPRFPNYFNVLKQEYASARFMLYQAINTKADKEHYSDHSVLLLDGYDAAKFGYRTEQLKASYRIAYSLFDKIALFINDYFSVGMKAGAVSFRGVWGSVKNKKIALKPCFERSQNWPLRGLYYVSKDLFDVQFQQVSLPEAKELSRLRNHAEHRFLSLQSYNNHMDQSEEHTYIDILDFENKTLKIFSMIREALIYLSLAMHREEIIRYENTKKLSVPVYSRPIRK